MIEFYYHNMRNNYSRCAKELDFERAAQLRDILFELKGE